IFPYHEGLNLIASNVTDFGLRNESYLEYVSPIQTHRVYQSRLYATTGVNLSSSRTTGHLVVFNLSTGGSYTDYETGDFNQQITAVTLDADHVFVTRTPLIFSGGIFGHWVYDPANAQILAKKSPARTGLFTGGDSFQSIVLQ